MEVEWQNNLAHTPELQRAESPDFANAAVEYLTDTNQPMKLVAGFLANKILQKGHREKTEAGESKHTRCEVKRQRVHGKEEQRLETLQSQDLKQARKSSIGSAYVSDDNKGRRSSGPSPAEFERSNTSKISGVNP